MKADPVDNDGSEETIQPGFLMATERSGSNLLRSILNTHPKLTAPHPIETTYGMWKTLTPITEMSEARARRLIRDVIVAKRYSFQPLHVPISIDRVHELFEADRRHPYLSVQNAIYRAAVEVEGTSTWISKSPETFYELDDLVEYYDDPKIVYLVRDPRDVVLSFKTSGVGHYHVYFSAKRWQQEQAKGRSLLEAGDADVHVVTYESLLQDAEGTAKAICEFLEVPYDARMLHFYESEDAQQTATGSESFENVSSPIMSENFEKWRNRLSEAEIAITESVVAEELEYFGYELHMAPEERAIDHDVEEYEREDERLKQENEGLFTDPREFMNNLTWHSLKRYFIVRYGTLG